MTTPRQEALDQYRLLVRSNHSRVLAARATSEDLFMSMLAKTGVQIADMGEHLINEYGYDIQFLKRVVDEECEKSDRGEV